MPIPNDSGFIFASYLNNYHYLWADGDALLGLSGSPQFERNYLRTQLARTAALLYIMAFEGLMNRALGTFLKKEDRELFLAGERELGILGKLDMLLERAPMSQGRIDKSCYPWSHMKEVVELRNDYFHPKFGRFSFLEVFRGHIALQLKPERIPDGLSYAHFEGDTPHTITKDYLTYPQTGLPKDPKSFVLDDANIVKRIISDLVAAIDELLGGQLSKDNWKNSDHLKLVFPPNTTLDDPLPPYPEELRRKYGC